ncbi:hypothetical protein AVEN_242550-1, partial [Araneus ventricosus]
GITFPNVAMSKTKDKDIYKNNNLPSFSSGNSGVVMHKSASKVNDKIVLLAILFTIIDV